VDRVARASGWDFGLWIEPEAVSPKVPALPPSTRTGCTGIEGAAGERLIRNELLLDLGRPEVYTYLRDTNLDNPADQLTRSAT